MLRLRPHHLIDIIRNIGQDRSLAPHPYGHAQHTITRLILDRPRPMVKFIVDGDDLCQPCRYLNADNQCTDVLPQISPRILKQQYNDELDRRILAYLGMREGAVMPVDEFIGLIKRKLSGIIPLCVHPGERPEDRLRGLKMGISKLGEKK